MATIGVGKGSYIRPYNKVRMESYAEDSSQTFLVGDPVYLSTDAGEGNLIKVATADPTTDRSFLGFAAQAASGVKGTMCPIWLASNDALFVGHICDAAFADKVLDINIISTELGMIADTTNLIWRVDTSESTAKLVRIVKALDAHGDTNARVVFMVIAPERLYGD